MNVNEKDEFIVSLAFDHREYPKRYNVGDLIKRDDPHFSSNYLSDLTSDGVITPINLDSDEVKD